MQSIYEFSQSNHKGIEEMGDRVAESIFVVVDGGGEWLYSKYLVRFDHFGRYDTPPGGFKQVPTSAAAQDCRLRV